MKLNVTEGGVNTSAMCHITNSQKGTVARLIFYLSWYDENKRKQIEDVCQSHCTHRSHASTCPPASAPARWTC